MRHPGVPSAGDNPVQGLRKVRRLVELRGAHLRDERGLLAVLLAQSHEDLREDSRGQVPLSALLQRGPQGSSEESVAGRPDEAIREPEERADGREEAQVVQQDRLDEDLQ